MTPIGKAVNVDQLHPDHVRSRPPGFGRLDRRRRRQRTGRELRRLLQDALLDVFQRTRSQLTSVGCDVGDAHGRAQLSLRPTAGADYLVRVAQRDNSVPGDFTLQAFIPEAPPQPPGRHLPRHGALDALQHTAEAFSFSMRPGHSSRFNLAIPDGGTCMSLALYPPRTRDFDSGEPASTLSCGGYGVSTPPAGSGGRYSLLVRAADGVRGRQRYHLQAGPVGHDDVAPGRELRNYVKARGSLNGRRLDVVDLYRFALGRRQ